MKDETKLSKIEVGVATELDDEIINLTRENTELRNENREIRQLISDMEQRMSKKLPDTEIAKIFQKIETDTTVKQREKDIHTLAEELKRKDERFAQEVMKRKEGEDKLALLLNEVEADKNLKSLINKVKVMEAELARVVAKINIKKNEYNKLAINIETVRADYNALVVQYNDKIEELSTKNVEFGVVNKALADMKSKFGVYQKKDLEIPKPKKLFNIFRRNK